MKRKLLFGLLILTLVALPVCAAACKEEVTPQGEEEEEGPPGEEEEEEANWWDKFGEPEYGGTIVIREASVTGANFDPGEFMGHPDLLWFERLFCVDWTLDRSIWSFTYSFTPAEYYQGLLAESWEQTDPQTITVHLRKEAHWQDKEPLNGRGVTAYDVQYTYDRFLGTGSGFTEPNPIFSAQLSIIERAVATDDHTVVFKLKEPSAMAIYQIMEESAGVGNIVAPELVEQGLLNDWENAVGTGPWMLTDFVQGSSLTCSRNPNYWRYDERHPQNQLPYADTLKLVAIPDASTMLAALRAGNIDMMITGRSGISCVQAASLAETNPEIQQAWWANPGCSVALRCDKAPFTDINVRKALQMAIDRKVIAEAHYCGTVDGTPAGLSLPAYTEWVTPYAEWPEELQAEYSYNPELAMQLLAEAAADGVFEPNEYGGFDTNIIACSEDDLELLQVIKSYFMDIGVDMEIETFVDMPTFQNFAMAGNQDQMTFTNTCGMPMRPDASLSRYTSTNPENYAHNNDSVYDDLYSQFSAAATIDEAKRLSVEMQMYALRQHWAVNVIPYNVPIFWQPWVKGYSGEQYLLMGGCGYNLAALWIDQALKASMGY